MQTTYRPPCRAAATRWSPSASGAAVPVPFIDEDEATMAVESAHALLAAAHLGPEQLRRVVVSSRTTSGFGPLVADALGIVRERVEEGTALLYGQTRFPSPGEGPVLHIQSDAPRPGSEAAVGEGAFATARLTGDGIPSEQTLEISVASWTADAETVAELARWEREAPRRTTMGAFVPKPTWDRNAPARYRLEGSGCSHGHLEFPPRRQCSRCGQPSGPLALPRPGRLETFTVIAKGGAPSEFEPLQAVAGEYAVGVADFGGARVPGLVCETSLDSLRVGLTIEPVFRRLYGQDGEWRYGTKFRARTR